MGRFALSPPVIRTRDLHFSYPDGTLALNGIDFDLFEGETVALLGANGSGKTTFVLHLNGLMRGRGLIEIDGISLVPGREAEVRSKVGIVFQDSDNQLFMPTVLEDVAFGPLNYGAAVSEAERTAREALAMVGATHLADRAPYHLSAGEKKRAAIAGVLAMRPKILVLDEPTTFLDPPSRRGLIRLLTQLPQAKLLVTHDVTFAAAVASRAVFFERGRVMASGNVSEVASRFDWLDPA